MYFLEEGFGNRSSSVTYTNRTESSFNTVNISDYPLEEIFKNIDVLHICGISLAMNEMMRQNILEIVKAAREHNIQIVLIVILDHLFGVKVEMKKPNHIMSRFYMKRISFS